MSDIIKEVRVRDSVYQDRDVKVTIEKAGLFNKKRKLTGVPWGKKEEAWHTWEPIEFVVGDLTEENNFGEYERFYAAYIKERDEPLNMFGGKSSNFHQRNNLEFSTQWNSDLDIIKLYILINAEKHKTNVYEWMLIEDPIVGEKGGLAPYYRSFGVDDYHLNNGVKITIDWRKGQIGELWSDAKGNEVDETNPKFYFGADKLYKASIEKVVGSIWLPEGVTDPNVSGRRIKYSDNYFGKNKEGKDIHGFLPEGDDREQRYGGLTDDTVILNQIIRAWKSNTTGYENLDFVKSEHGSPAIYLSQAPEYTKIEYKSPFGTELGPSQSGLSQSGLSQSGLSQSGLSQSVAKFMPTFMGLVDGFQITAKTDMPSFSVYVGDPEKWPVPEDIQEKVEEGVADDFEDIDEEYLEEDFKGAEEMGITVEEYKYQSDVSDGQEDADSGVTEPGAPADIKPVSSFDALLKLAGSCARELGKNPRVKWENLRRGYVKGVHGLCPQGTQAVLYAMTGIKACGQISGNADYFSFRNGGKSKFPSKYFNDKIKVGKDYWKNKSQWQIGDVIAVGYTGGKPYGHIQVWTGVKWMSDFSQNALQSSHVDWDTPALWRLNSTGVEAVKKQMKSIS